MQNSVPSGVTKHLLLFLLTLNHSVHRKLQETEDSPQAHVSPGGTGPCLCSPHRSCFSSVVSSRGVKPFPFIFLQSVVGPQNSSSPSTGTQTACPPVCPDGPWSPSCISRRTFAFLLFLSLAVLGLSCSTHRLHWICAIFCFCGADSLVVLHGLACPVACGILVPQTGIEPMSSELQDIDSEPLDPSPNRDGTHVL